MSKMAIAEKVEFILVKCGKFEIKVFLEIIETEITYDFLIFYRIKYYWIKI